MSNTKEIRTKIKSIQNTRKITSAMEMVAASKMKHAQERMFASKPYATMIREVIAHLAKSNSEYRHVYFNTRKVKSIGYIVVTSDKGLCGGLNNNLLRLLLKQMMADKANGVDSHVSLFGKKAEAFFSTLEVNILSSAVHLGDKPSIVDLIGTVKTMLDAFVEEKVDKVCLVSNGFVNTMIQEPKITKILPVSHELTEQEKGKADKGNHHWDYLYEPDSHEILTQLLTRFIESQVYQSVIENIACEQAARMVAMKSASDNASDLIDEFKLIYNKVRQAAITQELSEIIAGAAAV